MRIFNCAVAQMIHTFGVARIWGNLMENALFPGQVKVRVLYDLSGEFGQDLKRQWEVREFEIECLKYTYSAQEVRIYLRRRSIYLASRIVKTSKYQVVSVGLLKFGSVCTLVWKTGKYHEKKSGISKQRASRSYATI